MPLLQLDWLIIFMAYWILANDDRKNGGNTPPPQKTNAVVVHCQAGHGRSGMLIVACLMRLSAMLNGVNGLMGVEEAQRMFTQARLKAKHWNEDELVPTRKSQRRYLHYYHAKLLQERPFDLLNERPFKSVNEGHIVDVKVDGASSFLNVSIEDMSETDKILWLSFKNEKVAWTWFNTQYYPDGAILFATKDFDTTWSKLLFAGLFPKLTVTIRLSER